MVELLADLRARADGEWDAAGERRSGDGTSTEDAAAEEEEEGGEEEEEEGIRGAAIQDDGCGDVEEWLADFDTSVAGTKGDAVTVEWTAVEASPRSNDEEGDYY